MSGPLSPERDYLYGYNYDEVDLPEFDDTDPPGGKVTRITRANRLRRNPEMVSLLSRVVGGVYFRPNTADPLSAERGLRKRLIHPRPPIDPRLLKKLKVFAQDWLKRNLVPLSFDEVPDFEDWVTEVNQPQSVKDEYREAYRQLMDGEIDLRKKLAEKKIFVKAEFYPEPKYHRCIHAPTNYEKVLHGPIASAMEKKLFALAFFIKKVPRRDWPEYISIICSGVNLNCYASDYSSFEASFVPQIQRILELAFTKYMCTNLLADQGVDDILHTDRKRVFVSKMLNAFVTGRRASGQMMTSLFNGFTNLVVNEFVCTELCGASVFRGVVEGDDGLFVHNGRPPLESDFLRLGFIIKIVNVKHFTEASFCGVVFDPNVCTTIGDPWRILMSVSWAGQDYLRSNDETLRILGVVKALSYLAGYPRCPVTTAVADWLLRTNDFDQNKLEYYLRWYTEQRATGWWLRQEAQSYYGLDYEQLRLQTVPIENRMVVERVFHMPMDVQLMLEERFRTSERSVDVSDIVPEKYRLNYLNYVRKRTRFDRELGLFFDPPPILHDEDRRRDNAAF